MDETFAMTPTGMLWAQLLGVGFFWITLHCGGMCGPIMTGVLMHAGRDLPGESSWRAVMRRSRAVLAYQAGRASVYALMGAAAAGLGAAFEAAIEPVTHLATALAALAMIVVAISGMLRPAGRAGGAGWAGAGRLLGRVVRALGRRAPRRGPWRMMAVGAALALMPCAIMFWVLGLATATADPLHGAAMMVTLVGLTTPMLIGVACSVVLVPRRVRERARALIYPALLAASVWLLLISAAANAWIPHAHWTFELFGSPYMIMFW